jgi:hypothetical protein
MTEAVGLFDEGFFPAFYEETDLCARARAAGYRVVYEPQAVATHYETTSVSRQSTQYHRWMARGRLRYVLKHWSEAQFFEDFLPAERLWASSLALPEMRDGLRMAYLDTLVGLRSVPASSVLSNSDRIDEVARAIADLRDQLSRLSDWGVPVAAQSRPQEGRDLPGPGTSQPKPKGASGLRSAVARLRRRLEHRWYMRHLTLRKELRLVQETMVAVDRETSEAYRGIAQALYGLGAHLEDLERRIGLLEEG